MTGTISDVFSGDAFNMLSMTDALIKSPYQEARIGQLGLFGAAEGLETNVAVIDEKDGQLQVLATKPRGGESNRADAVNLKSARSFIVPHIPFEDRLTAASLLGKRALGTTELESVAAKVADKLAMARQHFETTFEIHRLNSLKGILTDADGSTIYNWFTEFGLAQQTKDFVFSDATFDVRNAYVDTARLIETELGGVGYTGIKVLAGKNWFDACVSAEAVKDTLRHQESQLMRSDLRKGFDFGGANTEEYRGMLGIANGTGVIGDDVAYAVPVGVPGMFRCLAAPGDFMETVNTLGQLMYAKVAPDTKWNKWVDMYAESNPLFINTRPRAVIKLTKS